LDASIRVEGSHSHAIADIVEDEWLQVRPDAAVVRRHIGVNPITATAWDPRMAAGANPLLAGKPAVLLTVRGGTYGSGTPREGWDHATGRMRHILQDVWQLDLSVVETEFTLVGVNPALDQFDDLAANLRQETEEHARRSGQKLGASVVATVGA
jgi:FMN-dependent NADH-azoreductase